MRNNCLEGMLTWQEKDLSDGQRLVLREYLQSKKNGWEYLTIIGICWERDYLEIIQTLINAGIKTFILADTSTGLMSTLHAFLNAGFQVKGAKVLTKKPAGAWDTPIMGLEIGLVEKSCEKQRLPLPTM